MCLPLFCRLGGKLPGPGMLKVLARRIYNVGRQG